MVRGAFLDRQGDDVTGLLFALLLGAAFDFPHRGGGVVERFLLHPFDHRLPGLVLGHGGDALQFGDLLLLDLLGFGFQLLHVGKFFFQAFLPGGDGILALIQLGLALIQRFFPLLHAALGALQFGAAGAAFLIQFALELQYFFLGSQDHFLFAVLRFSRGVVQQLLGVFFRAPDLLFGYAFAIGVAHIRADQQSDQRDDNS